MSYFSQKVLHAYNCYINGKPRQKVYGVIEKGNKFVVLRGKSENKYMLSGGGIEEGEDLKTAIEREALEELNMVVEFIKELGSFTCKSKWKYNGQEFWVDDHIQVVYTKFIKYGSNNFLGIEGEFESQDIVAEISKEEMLNNVYEFVEGGIKF